MAARTGSAAGAAGGASITVTQTRSGIGTKPKHRGTLRALGLHGVGTTNTLPDRPEIRGMIARVPHLVTVAESATATTTGTATGTSSGKPAATPAGKPAAQTTKEA